MYFSGTVISVCLLFANVVFVFADGSNLQMDITQNGINYANVVVINALKQRLQTLTIPALSGDGRLSYSVSNIQNRGITGPNSNIVLSPGNNGLKLTISDLGANLYADWRASYKFIFRFRASGSVDASFTGVSLSVTVGLGEKNGRPSLIARDCNSSIGGLSLRIYGGLIARLVSLFKRTIERKFRAFLQSKICDLVNDAINGPADVELAKLKVNAVFGHVFGIDYSLSSAPFVSSNYLQTQHKGNIYWNENGNTPSSYCTPAAFPPLTNYNRMLYISISECMLNTFAYVAHTNNYLVYKVSINELLKNIPILQKSASEAELLQTDTDVELYASTSAPPTVKFSENKLTVSVVGNVSVAQISDPSTKLFTLGLNVNVTIQPRIVNEKLVATIFNYSLDFSIQNSDIGDLDKNGLNSIVKSVIDTQILPQVNTFGNNGIDLPVTSQVSFTYTAINLQNGYLRIETDVHL